MTDYNRYTFNKLVRDKSVAHMEFKEAQVAWHPLSAREHVQALLAKLEEERLELQDAFQADDRAEIIAEFADVMEVVHALANLRGVTVPEIEAARLDKADQRGCFNKGMFVTEILSPKGSFYDVYCAKDPAKYKTV